MPGSPGFKKCVRCKDPMPASDGHDACIRCLGESHVPGKCAHCSKLTARARKDRDMRLKLILFDKALQPSEAPQRESSRTLEKTSPPCMGSTQKKSKRVSPARSLAAVPRSRTSEGDQPGTSGVGYKPAKHKRDGGKSVGRSSSAPEPSTVASSTRQQSAPMSRERHPIDPADHKTSAPPVRKHTTAPQSAPAQPSAPTNQTAPTRLTPAAPDAVPSDSHASVSGAASHALKKGVTEPAVRSTPVSPPHQCRYRILLYYSQTMTIASPDALLIKVRYRRRLKESRFLEDRLLRHLQSSRRHRLPPPRDIMCQGNRGTITPRVLHTTTRGRTTRMFTDIPFHTSGCDLLYLAHHPAHRRGHMEAGTAFPIHLGDRLPITLIIVESRTIPHMPTQGLGHLIPVAAVPRSTSTSHQWVPRNAQFKPQRFGRLLPRRLLKYRIPRRARFQMRMPPRTRYLHRTLPHPLRTKRCFKGTIHPRTTVESSKICLSG